MSTDHVLPTRSGFALRQFDVFKDLPAQRVDEIANQCAWSSVEAGTSLMCRKGGCSDVVFVVSGAVRISAHAGDGKDVAIWTMGPGDLFGYVVDDAETGVYLEAVAQTPAVVARQSRESFRQLVSQEPTLAERLMLRLLSRTSRLVERVIDLSTLGVGQRLEVELLRLARQGGSGVNDGASVRPLPAIRHADLASLIGTNREQVTREVNRLVREGILAKNGRQLMIADPAGLERRVSASRGYRQVVSRSGPAANSVLQDLGQEVLGAR